MSSAVPGALLMFGAGAGLLFLGRGVCPGNVATLSGAGILCAVIFGRAWVDGGGSWAGWQDWLIVLMFLSYLIFSGWASNRKFYNGFLLMATVGVLAQSIIVILQSSGIIAGHPLAGFVEGMTPSAQDVVGKYISGTLPTRTIAGAVFNSVAFLILGSAVWGRWGVGWRIFLFWVACILFTSVILCQSRAAILGMLAGGAAFAVCTMSISSRYEGGKILHGFVTASIFFMILSGLLWLFFNENWGVRGKIATIHDDSYRIRLWLETANHFSRDKLLTGIGAGAFHNWSKVFSGRGTGGDPVFLHNDWLQLVIEHGIILGGASILFFLFILACGFLSACRIANSLEGTWGWPKSTSLGSVVGGVTSSCSLAVHGFFDYALQFPALLILLGVSVGAASIDRPGSKFIESRGISGKICVFWYCCSLAGFSIMAVRDCPSDIISWRAWRAQDSGNIEEAWNLLRLGNFTYASRDLVREGGRVATKIALLQANHGMRKQWLKKSVEMYKVGLERDPSDPLFLREAGLCSVLAGDFPEGERMIRQAISMNPNSPRGYEYLGLCFQRQGRLKEARKAYKAALSLGPAPIALANFSNDDI